MKRQRNGFQNSSLPIYRDSLTLVNKATFGWVGSGYLICYDATSEWLVSPAAFHFEKTRYLGVLSAILKASGREASGR